MPIVMIMVTRAFLKFLAPYDRTYFHPPTKLLEGNIFSRVRLSVHRGGLCDYNLDLFKLVHLWTPHQPGPFLSPYRDPQHLRTCSNLFTWTSPCRDPLDMFKLVQLDLTIQGPPPTWDYLKSWLLAFDLNAFMFPMMLQFVLLLPVRIFYVQFYFSALALNLLAQWGIFLPHGKWFPTYFNAFDVSNCSLRKSCFSDFVYKLD